MFIVENRSEFTINWMYLSVRFKGGLYKTERRFGECGGKVFIVLHKEFQARSCFDYYYNNKGFGNERWNIAFFRHATEEEKQFLFESMKERGLFWNADKKDDRENQMGSEEKWNLLLC